MKAILSRALAALACLTLLWADARAIAADALPSTISQIRNAQSAGVNTIEALLYRWPHDYYAVVRPSPIAQTNVSVFGLTAEALTNKLREVAYRMVCLATNLQNGTSMVTNLIVVTAKEADIPTIFPRAGQDVPATTLEMAQINVTFRLTPDGMGGFTPPPNTAADPIPINVGGYVFLPFPNLKYFEGAPPLLWYWDSMYERQTYARIFVGNPNGSISEVPSKAFGSATINQMIDDPAKFGEYLYADDMKLLRLFGIGRIGIHLSLLTNGTPAVFALEAADGTFPRYWLPTGQPIERPVLTSISLSNDAPRVGLVGMPNRRVVIESAVSLGSTAVWNVETTLTLPDQHGMTNYAGPASLGPSTGPRRFLRLREE